MEYNYDYNCNSFLCQFLFNIFLLFINTVLFILYNNCKQEKNNKKSRFIVYLIISILLTFFLSIAYVYIIALFYLLYYVINILYKEKYIGIYSYFVFCIVLICFFSISFIFFLYSVKTNIFILYNYLNNNLCLIHAILFLIL